HELRRVAPDDLRLVLFRRGAVAFRPAFPIEKRQVERDRRRLERLAILPWNLVIRPPEPSQPRIDVDPTQHRPKAKHLMTLQDDRLTRPLPLVVLQLLHEGEKPRHAAEIEPIRERRTALPLDVPQMPFTRQPVIP